MTNERIIFSCFIIFVLWLGFISKHIADTKFQECLETACKQGNRGHPFLKSLCSHTLPSLFYKAVHKHGDQAYQQ